MNGNVGDVWAGISYPITIRATPARTGEGTPAISFDHVMWSADLATGPDGSGLTASGASPTEALANLQAVIAAHTLSEPATPAPEEAPE